MVRSRPPLHHARRFRSDFPPGPPAPPPTLRQSNFDPNTGQPIVATGQPKFDPNTGQPVAAVGQPVMGQPVVAGVVMQQPMQVMQVAPGSAKWNHGLFVSHGSRGTPTPTHTTTTHKHATRIPPRHSPAGVRIARTLRCLPQDICADPAFCCFAYFCTPCAIGTNGGKLGRTCIVDCCMSNFYCWGCATMDQRTNIRNRFGLPEDMDCIASYFCCCCAACQHHNEMRSRGIM